jgi:hypothetical protein
MDNEKKDLLSECLDILSVEVTHILSRLHEEWIILTEEGQSDFIETTFNQMLENEDTSGDELVKELKDFKEKNADELFSLLYLLPICTSCAYTAQAVKMARLAKKKPVALKEISMAWSFISKARWWLGAINGRRSHIEFSQDRKKSNQKKAADARHEESRELKQIALEFYEKNIDSFKSKDSGAEAMIKQVPIAFRTARHYIDQYHKEK